MNFCDGASANMRRRVPHRKSREGCLNCKKRHVKCDEQKPTCANCIITSRNCTYGERSLTARATQPRRIAPVSQQLDGDSQSPSKAAGLPSIVKVDSPSPVSFSSTSSYDHKLELELIHTWTVETWTGMQVLPGCEHLLRVNYIRESLEHRFMMDAILALAATHRSYSHKQAGDAAGYARYDYASILYGNRASEGFRLKLRTATPEDLHVLYYFASMAAVLNLLVCRQYSRALDCFQVSLSLFLGSFSSSETNLDWIQKSIHSVAIRAEMVDTPPELFERVPHETKQALDRLQEICDTVRVPRGSQTRDTLASEVEAYQRAVRQARISFAQQAAGQTAGFFFTITAVGGRELAAAVAAREPVSLLIHLYGFVLMNEVGASRRLWWVGSIAREMAGEIMEYLTHSPIGEREDVHKVIKWARDAVGLPSMEARQLLPPLCTWETPEMASHHRRSE